MPADTPPLTAVKDFLEVFGTDLQRGAGVTDASGVTLAITKALFQDGRGEFKWLANQGKATRLEYVNLLAMTLIEPDEIWWAWEKSRNEAGRWLLRRRYLRAFQINGTNEYGIAAFEWGRTGWKGSTVFMSSQQTEEARKTYFDKQRIGRMVYRKVQK